MGQRAFLPSSPRDHRNFSPHHHLFWGFFFKWGQREPQAAGELGGPHPHTPQGGAEGILLARRTGGTRRPHQAFLSPLFELGEQEGGKRTAPAPPLPPTWGAKALPPPASPPLGGAGALWGCPRSGAEARAPLPSPGRRGGFAPRLLLLPPAAPAYLTRLLCLLGGGHVSSPG